LEKEGRFLDTMAAALEELALARSTALAAQAEAVDGDGSLEPFRLLVFRLDGVDGPGLQMAAPGLADQLGDGADLDGEAGTGDAGCRVGRMIRPNCSP
jgi:hypothetical protein